MKRNPRSPKEKLLNAEFLAKSILQGLTIFAASFGAYYYTLMQNPDEATVARTMGFAVIMLANLFLVQVNSSEIDSIFVSIKRLSKDKVMWAVNIFTVLGLVIFIYTPFSGFLRLAPLTAWQMLAVFILAAVSVLWYEVVKLVKRSKKHR
jgi:Ca2+-transporting ATPase